MKRAILGAHHACPYMVIHDHWLAKFSEILHERQETVIYRLLSSVGYDDFWLENKHGHYLSNWADL